MPFKPGQSGNKSGRPTIVKEIKVLALKHSARAFQRIVELSESDDPKVAIVASKEILDRAYGKPAQAVEVTGKEGGAIAVIYEYDPKNAK